MKSIGLSITKKRIDKAVKKNSHRCMIADTVREQVKNAKYISVDLQKVAFSVGSKRYTYFTPPLAQHSLLKFDRGEQVEPFKCRLTEGKVGKAGLHNTHPNWNESKRKKHYYPKNRLKRPYPTREREFGLRKLK